jgi:Fe-S cluster biogenesis protein NfuA
VEKFQERVQEVFRDCLEAMVVDGGGADLEFVEIGIVIRLKGSCEHWPSRTLSAQALVRRMQSQLGINCSISVYNSKGGELLAKG